MIFNRSLAQAFKLSKSFLKKVFWLNRLNKK